MPSPANGCDPSDAMLCKVCGAVVWRASRPDSLERLFRWLFQTVRCWHCNRRYYLFSKERLLLAINQRGMRSAAQYRKRSGSRKKADSGRGI